MKELLNEVKWKNNSLLSAFDSSRYFYELYLELVNSVSHSFDLLNNQIIKEIKDIVEFKICGNPTIDEISATVGLTREHLSRIFHTYTGNEAKDVYNATATYICMQPTAKYEHVSTGNSRKDVF